MWDVVNAKSEKEAKEKFILRHPEAEIISCYPSKTSYNMYGFIYCN
ncbi:MAG: hypothetical protein WC123_07490 [Bacilli bacterium]|jgi:hypothetical protein